MKKTYIYDPNPDFFGGTPWFQGPLRVLPVESTLPLGIPRERRQISCMRKKLLNPRPKIMKTPRKLARLT